MIEYFQIKNKEELWRLKDKSAKYEDLNFSFPDEYITKLSDYLKTPDGYQLFAVNKTADEIAGYTAASENLFPKNLFIHELFVDPKYQRKGIGRELIERIIEYAKKKKLKGVITETEFKNIPAQKLYEKMGFVKIDNPEWTNGITYGLKLA